MSVNIYDKVTGELIQIAGNANGVIDDANVSNKTTYSSEKIEELINNSAVVKTNQWKGKKVVWLGTSVSFGQYATTSYAVEASNKLGFTLKNCSVPGLAIHTRPDGSKLEYGSFVLTKSEYQAQGITIPNAPIDYVPGGSYNDYYRTYENVICNENKDADLWVLDVAPNNSIFNTTDWDNFDFDNWKYKPTVEEKEKEDRIDLSASNTTLDVDKCWSTQGNFIDQPRYNTVTYELDIKYTKVNISAYYGVGVYGGAFLDESKAFISSFSTDTTKPTSPNGILDIPENAKYIALTASQSKGDYNTIYCKYIGSNTIETTFADHRATFLGALLFIMDKIYTLNPQARIVFVLGSSFGYQRGKEAFEKLVYKWNIPLINLWRKVNISPKSLVNLKSQNGTNSHPSTYAHKIMGNMLANELLLIS